MKSSSMLVWSLVAASTLAGGMLQGHFRNRWGGPESAQAAAEHLPRLPARVGEWETIQTTHLSENEQNTLQSYGHVGRVYRHQRTGETVNLSILVGPFGPTAAHTPEVCLSSSEYRPQGVRQSLTLPGSADAFWTVVFHSTDVEQRHLRVTYAWTFNGTWVAARQPRFQFAASPYLYKLSLSCGSNDDAASLETCRQFLESLLPELVPVIDAANQRGPL
jgi:hypothetical protein